MLNAANSDAEALVRSHGLGFGRVRLFAVLVLAVAGLVLFHASSSDGRLVVSGAGAGSFVVVSERIPASKRTSAHPERFVQTQIERIASSGSAKRLARLPKQVGAVVFSPDHRQVALTFRGWLEVMRIDGGARRRIARIWGKSEPTWSPDGRRLAFSLGGHIYSASVDGHDRRRLTNSRRWDDTPAWSPRGRQIAFVRWQQGPGSAPGLGTVHHWDHVGGRVWVIRADGMHERKLRRFGNSPADLAWSPDGKEIAARDCCPESGDPDPLWLLSVDGRRITIPATLQEDYQRSRPVWAPRGNIIAIVTDSVLNVIDAHDSSVRFRLHVAHLASCCADPAWSREGSNLALSGCSQAYGPCGVSIVNAVTGTATKLIHLPADVVSVRNIAWTR